jgi:radical SAM superfamily enzyme YgiQ (UPF0313 family)
MSNVEIESEPSQIKTGHHHGSLKEMALKPVNKSLERVGFIPVDQDPKVAMMTRLDSLRAAWALNGLDCLLPVTEGFMACSPSDPRVESLIQRAYVGNTESDQRLANLVDSLLGIPSRKSLLVNTIKNAYSKDPSEAQEARRKLAKIIDIIDDRIDKPNPHSDQAVILTQTAYLQGDGSRKEQKIRQNLDYGPMDMVKLAVDIGSGTLPYLGAAVVYSELMATGKFSTIKIIDFRDEVTINELMRSGQYRYAFVAGATSFESSLIIDLNEKLSSAGITVVNGGIAATNEDSGRLLEAGGSVFIGNIEGAADMLVKELERDSNPRFFIRGDHNHKKETLSTNSIPFTEFTDLPIRADLKDMYAPQRELEGERLANRLLALEMMRPFIEFNGQRYDTTSWMRYHETNVSFGCPNSCVFCASVPSQGTQMRARSIESLEQEWNAVDALHVVIVDQNFTANGREYVTEVLKLAKKYHKRLAFQGELLFFSPSENRQRFGNYFFDGSSDDAQRRNLLREVVTAMEVGLEQPFKMKGTRDENKNPKQYAPAIKLLSDLGIIVFGTMMVGVPPELSDQPEAAESISPKKSLNKKDWNEMIQIWAKWPKQLGLAAPVIFPFTITRGSRAYDQLSQLNLLDEEQGDIAHYKGFDTDRAVSEIRRRVYSPGSIFNRVIPTNLSLKHKLMITAFNLITGNAFRDNMA